MIHIAKKRWKAFAGVFAVLYILIFLAKTPGIDAMVTAKMTLGAHRGSSVEFRENTIDAIKSAIENPKYNFVEFDVQYTKDNKIVVFHDWSLLRMQLKIMKISELTYEEITNMTDYHIPLYEEVIELIGNKKKVNIEIKPKGSLIGDYEEDIKLTDYIISDCEQRGIKQDLMISSISPRIIEYVSENYPEMKTGIVYWVTPITYIPSERLVQNFYEKTEAMGADYILLHGINVKNYDLLSELKPEDTTLVFWYFNDKVFIIENASSAGSW